VGSETKYVSVLSIYAKSGVNSGDFWVAVKRQEVKTCLKNSVVRGVHANSGSTWNMGCP
jgi:hypothetical protein